METLPTKIAELQDYIDDEFEKIYNLTVDGTLQWKEEGGVKFVLQRPLGIEADNFPSITLYSEPRSCNVVINGVVIDLSPSRIEKICHAAKKQSEADNIRTGLTNSLLSLRKFTEIFEKERT